MCRWIAYRGETITLERYVTAPAHSLVVQSMRALEGNASTNGVRPLKYRFEIATDPTFTNPVFINLIAVLLFGKPLRGYVIFSLLLCSAGVVLAAWPLLQNSSATPGGLLILLVSMLAYSGGVLYFSRCSWNNLSIMAINGWQTLLGGVFLLPFAAFAYDAHRNVWDWRTIGAVLWLAIPVSIVAVQLWLYLLKDDAARASFWLFLCPVSGFLIAHWVMKEPIGLYTIAGMGLVIGGLYLVQRRKSG